MPQFKTAYSKPVRHSLSFAKADSVTEQSHKDACDVNKILSKFQRTGVLEHRNAHRGQYGFATSGDFQNAMFIVAKAQSMFADLPSHIRDKFDHDPGKFLDFVQNDENAPEMVKLGLAKSVTDTASKTPQIDVETLRQGLEKALNPEEPSSEAATAAE